MRVRDRLGVFSCFLLILCALCLLPSLSGAQPPTSVLPPGTLPLCSTDPTPPTSLVARRGCVMNDGSVYYGDSGGSAVATGGAGITNILVTGADGDSSTTISDSGLELIGGLLSLLRGCTNGQVLQWNETTDKWSCATGGPTILTSGADGDSTTTFSDSGLELIGGFLTVLRGCTDGQTISWDETNDRWACGTKATTLESAKQLGAEVTSANSLGNAVVIGDGTDKLHFYVGTLGPTIECSIGGAACDTISSVPSGKAYKLYLNGTLALTISDTGTVTLGSLLYEVKPKEIPVGMCEVTSPCQRNYEVAIGDSTYRETVSCGDNDAATIICELSADSGWDEATLQVEMIGAMADDDPDGVLHADVAMVCIGDNESLASVTFGTEVALDVTTSGYAQNDQITTSKVTVPVTGCAAKDRVRIRYQVDATGTTNAEPLLTHWKSMMTYWTYNTWTSP